MYNFDDIKFMIEVNIISKRVMTLEETRSGKIIGAN